MSEQQRFDREAATWDDDPAHEERQRAVAHAIEESVELGPGTTALDVGGGTGRLSILLADKVGSVLVTDPSPGMVEVASERIAAAGLSDRLRAAAADLTTDHLDETFDVVWSSMALHHVQDVDRLLSSFFGLLNDHGRLAVVDLDRDSDGAFHADKPEFDGHHGFDREEFASRLLAVGFTDVMFADVMTIAKNGRDFTLFLCTATKGAGPGEPLPA